MSKRSNRTRGGRKLNMGASLRARQMPRGTVRKRPAGEIQSDINPDGLIDELLGQYLISEDSTMLVRE